MKQRQAAGLTLLELTISMAILMTVLGAVMISARGNNNDRRALQNASIMIQSDVRYAQRRAVMEGRRVYVQFEPIHNRYQVVMRNPWEELHPPVYLPNGVNLFSTNLSANRTGYTPRGTPTAAGTITLRNGRYSQDLTIVPNGGRIEIRPITP